MLLGENSFQIQKILQKLFTDKLTSYNLKVYLKIWICEYFGIPQVTEKNVKIDNNKLTAIQDHLLCWNYSPSLEDFSILTWESNDFKLKIMESVLIVRDKPVIYKAEASLPLKLFWYNISGCHLIFYHIIYAHLPHCTYTIVGYSVSSIMLQI